MAHARRSTFRGAKLGILVWMLGSCLNLAVSRSLDGYMQAGEKPSNITEVLTNLRASSKVAAVKLTTTYNLGAGLFNQHLQLLPLLSVAIAASVDVVVLPSALHRAHFHTLDVTSKFWQFAAPNTTWDIESITRLLASFGIGTEVQQHNQPLAPNEHVVNAGFFRDARLRLPAFADKIHGYIIENLRRNASTQRNTSATLHNLTLCLGNMYLSLQTTKCPLCNHVARSVLFAPHLRDMAAAVVSEMQHVTGSAQYNAVHLRLEQDAISAWLGRDGVSKVLDAYSQGIHNLALSPNLPLYLSSAISFKGTSAGSYKPSLAWLNSLVGRFASRVVHKGMFLRSSDAHHAPLLSEQAGVVDYLVMLNATKFMGLALSSMSMMAREMRKLSGHPVNHSLVVGPVFHLFDDTIVFDL